MPADRLVAAPSPALRGTVTVPGDKSISHRAVILAALTAGESRLEGLSDGDDVARTIAAVQAFGAEASHLSSGAISVRGGGWHRPAAPIDCGNAGTAARLLIGAAAGRGVTARFIGDSSLSRRPMAPLIEALGAMGARVSGGPTLPVTTGGGRIGGIRYVNHAASAQLKSAVLLAGLGTDAPVEVIEPRPSRDHSERMLRRFGVAISSREENGVRVISLGEERRPTATTLAVPADPSAAAFPLVAALITADSQVTVRGVLINPLRMGLFDTLAEMGADLRITNRREAGGEPVADLIAASSRLRGVTVPAERAPTMIDEYPILAVAAACAEGDTVMQGVGALRHKESDRIAAMTWGLAACGIVTRVDGESLIVRGGRARCAAISSHEDHRIAMSFLTLGLAAAAPIAVDDAAMIGTSFPGFAAAMRGLGAGIGPLP